MLFLMVDRIQIYDESFIPTRSLRIHRLIYLVSFVDDPILGGPTHYIGPDPIFGVHLGVGQISFPTEGSQPSESTPQLALKSRYETIGVMDRFLVPRRARNIQNTYNPIGPGLELSRHPLSPSIPCFSTNDPQNERVCFMKSRIVTLSNAPSLLPGQRAPSKRLQSGDGLSLPELVVGAAG